MDYIINLDFNIMLETLDYSKVPTVVLTSINFLKSYDMSLVRYSKRYGLINSVKDLGKFEIIFKIDDLQYIFDDGNLSEDYKNVIFEKYGTKLASVAPSNFILSKDKNKLATKDFRILLYDKRGNIPLRVMHHAATVAILILSGNYDLSLGLIYIQEIMKKYGHTEFVFHANGYCQIKIGKEPILTYKHNTMFSQKSA